MDALCRFPVRVSCLRFNSEINKNHAVKTFSYESLSWLKPRKTEKLQYCGFNADQNIKRRSNNQKYSVQSGKRAVNDSELGSIPYSVSQAVETFYKCINEKNLKQLGEYIHQDSQIDDYSFTRSFQGKQEVMQFLELLIAGMGQNVKFKVRNICDGDDFIATATWHLEWKKAQIPFTRGCSFFQCSKEGEKLKIKKVDILIESPVKPGPLVLILLKNMTLLFDYFPRETEWFLRSPHALLNWFLTIYKTLIRPSVYPLLQGYIKIWTFMAQVLCYIFKILVYIYEFFIK